MYLRSGIVASTMVHVRVDETTRTKAAKALSAMGITMSDAVRMMLVRVAEEKSLPFEVRVPNARTARALREAREGKGKRLKSGDDLFRHLGI